MAKILVVDDDRQTRQLYAALLTPFQHCVMEAADGREGLELVQKENPDLIISDILMPTMNGYDFVSAVRKIPTFNRVPVIFHSASFLDREARALGASCGVSLYILKPCDPEKILETVHGALGITVEPPGDPPPPLVESETIPLLLDAFFEKGQQSDATSVRLRALLELAMHFAGPWSANEVLVHAAAAARDILGANYASIGILEDDGPRLRSFVLSGVDPELASKIDKSAFNGDVFKEIVRQRRSQRAFNAFGKLPGLDLPEGHPPVKSFLGAPLQIDSRVYGWIYVAEKLASLEFDDQDAKVLAAVAAQTALACENAQRFRIIQAHATKLEAEAAERRRAEERFRMLVETAPTGIAIVDGKGRIVDANARTTQMFGYQRNELIGQRVETLIPTALRAAHEAHRASFQSNPHARPMGMGMDLLALRKDGTQFPVEISLGPLVTQGEKLISAAIVDITSRKTMEEQLRVSQRMEAIGRLAGGVAHDFNNLLTVILGCCEAFSVTMPADHPDARKIAMINKAAWSAADLTRQLLAFGRQQMLQPSVIQPGKIVADAGDFLRRLLGEDINFATAVDPTVGSIYADPGQIQQILINLATNARDAMPRGGQLTIEAANVDLDEEYRVLHPPVIPGPYVMFAVADTGCGIDRKTQARIFDPFFTTKELGKGTGLGLATVYGIVKQSGGFIWVYSELGKGTTFKVYLPRVEREAARKARPEPDAAPQRGTETILLAEDSESLREIASEYMTSLGYTVLETSSGKEALQRSNEFDGAIHLLLTDVVMPEMDGRELADEIVRTRPEIKVLFTSGYTDEAVVRHGVLEAKVAFLQKPYRPKALARKVREVLDTDRKNEISWPHWNLTGATKAE